MRRFVLLLFIALALAVPASAQSLDETLTLEFVGVSISYPTDWAGTVTSDLGFNIKENADDGNIFSATGLYIQGNIRGESLVPGTTLNDRVVAFIAANELEEVTGELRSTDTFEYGYAVLGNRQFILTPVGADFLMLQIAMPVRPMDDPLVTAIIESVSVGAGNSDAPDPNAPQTADADTTSDTTAASAPAADADGFIPISYDTEIIGTITDAQPEVLYIFEGKAGDNIVLSMVADDRNALDTTLWLYPLDEFDINAHIGYNDDNPVAGGTNSQIISTLPRGGQFVIKATRFSGEGEYTLTLEASGSAIQAINYGDAIAGELPDDTSSDVYRFTGSMGDEVTITMLAANEDALDTKLNLYRLVDYAAGVTLASNDDNIAVGIRNSQIVASLPENGEYIVEATRFSGAGPYTLLLEATTKDGTITADPAAAVPIEADTPDAETLSGGIPENALRQWASAATASSEYGSDDWSAMQATGEPDVNECADSTLAWASASGSGEESLTLAFAQAVVPLQVNIHQNLTPGGIVRVELTDAVTGETIVIADSTDPATEPCPRVFELSITDVDVPVNAVTVHLDESLVGYWNEIDAVELVGIASDADIPTAPVAELSNMLTDTQAASGAFSINYPAGWTAQNIGSNMLVMADSQAVIDMLLTDAVALGANNAYAFVADTATIVNTTSGDLEAINSAVLEAITTDANDSYGETQFLTLDDGRTVAKTSTTASGSEGYMYVTIIDGTAVGMQALAGNITAWEPTFDAMFATLTIEGASSAAAGTTGSTDMGAAPAASATLDEIGPLTSTIALEGAEDTFGALTVAYPDNWAAEQDGFNLVVSNSAEIAGQTLVNGGYLMPDTGNVAITAMTQGVLQYGGFQAADKAAEEVLSTFNMFTGSTDATETYEALEFPAFITSYTSGAFAPIGSVGITVEYPSGVVFYLVQYDGDFADIEPTVIDILNTATLGE